MSRAPSMSRVDPRGTGSCRPAQERGTADGRRSARIEALQQRGALGGRQALNEVEGERGGPAEPVRPESRATERVEVLVEPGACHEGEAAQDNGVRLVRL